MARFNSGGLVRKEKMDTVAPFADMDKYFDSFFRNPQSLMAAPVMTAPIREHALTPSVDIYNDGDDIVIKAEVPGISKDDLDLSIDRNVLTISGEKKRESKVEEKDYHCIERTYGTFTRSFKLPEDVSVDKAQASFNDGVLEIRMPRSGENRAKKIEIN